MSHDHLGAGADLDDAMRRVLDLAPGEELALFYFPADDDGSSPAFWLADAVNPDPGVKLGEISGRYRGEGTSAVEALDNLYKALAKDYT